VTLSQESCHNNATHEQLTWYDFIAEHRGKNFELALSATTLIIIGSYDFQEMKQDEY
jgi:hypothetical protein